nr:DUF262 domain-containing protein [Candidatus Nitrosopelagicus sp.]
MSYDSQKFKDNKIINPRELLSGNKRYQVPFSQRNFAWEDVEKNTLGKFWDSIIKQWSMYKNEEARKKILGVEISTGINHDNGDLLSSEEISSKREQEKLIKPDEMAEYFIGPMVFQSNDTDPNLLNVVDGQQRLTVLTMIFCIIRDLLNEFEENARIANPPVAGLYNFPPIFHPLTQATEEVDLAGRILSKGKWRFQPNEEDQELFNKIILPWVPEQHHEQNLDRPKTFREDKPDAPFLRLSEKIKYFEDQLKNNIEDYSEKPSNIRVMEAYISLYNRIWNGLLTQFEIEAEKQDEIENEIEANALKEAEHEIRLNYNNYKLKPEFFSGTSDTNINEWGIDSIQKKKWDQTNKEFVDLSWTQDEEDFIKSKFCTPRRMRISEEDFQTWMLEKSNKFRNEKLDDSSSKTMNGFCNQWPEFSGKYNDIFHKLKTTKVSTTRYSLGSSEENQMELFEFTNNMLMNLIFGVKVTVTKINTANKVFKTLNSTGTPLKTAEIIKAHILDKLSDSEQETYGKRWDLIIRKTKDKPDDFLELSLRSRGIMIDSIWEFNKFQVEGLRKPVPVQDDTLFDILEKMITSSIEAKQYVEDLEEDIEIFQRLNDISQIPEPTREQRELKTEIKPVLGIFQKLNYSYARMVILCAWRHWGWNEKEFSILVKLVTIWMYRFKTIRNQKGAGNTVNTNMTHICKEIRNNPGNTYVERQKVLERITKFLLQFDDTRDFEIELKKAYFGSFSSNAKKEVAQIILRQIEFDLGGHDRDMSPVDALTIEHVLPQKPRRWDESTFEHGWSTQPDETGTIEQQEMFRITEFFQNDMIPEMDHRLEDMIYKLGNLTLLLGRMNTQVSNKPFTEKKISYDNEIDLEPACRKDDATQPCPQFSVSDPPSSPADWQDTNCDLMIPQGTEAKCVEHGKKNGFNGSALLINKNTVTHFELDPTTERDEWTAISILKRTQWMIEKILYMWQLPKIYCQNNNCPKYTNPVHLQGHMIETIGNVRCKEKISGAPCGGILDVLWPRRGLAKELTVPSRFCETQDRFP